MGKYKKSISWMNWDCSLVVAVVVLLSVQLLATPWTAARQTPLSSTVSWNLLKFMSIKTSHPLPPPFPPALNLFQYQGLFQWVGFSNQVAKVLELQLQHQPFQWIFRVAFLRIDWLDLLVVQGTLKSLLQFSSTQLLSRVWLCDPMDCSTPGLPVHHLLLEFTQTHVHWVGDAIQWSHPPLSLSPFTFNLSQHQGLFKWVSFSHQVAKVLEFHLQHQSFHWIFNTDFL